MIDSIIGISVAGIGMLILAHMLIFIEHASSIVAYANRSLELIDWSQSVCANISKLTARLPVSGACNGQMCFRLIPLKKAIPCALQDVCRVINIGNASYEVVFYYESSNRS